ncbi:MAG: ribonuclease [Tsuneonella sp.]
MAEWLIERGIGEDRALLVDNGHALAARMRWSGELAAGRTVSATLVQRAKGASRGVAKTHDGHEILVDRLPKSASEGAQIQISITRAAMAERGRLKRAQGRWRDGDDAPSPDEFLAAGTIVRRFPASLWEAVWSEAWDGDVPFPGGTLLFAITPGMTVVDVDGPLPPRELALAAVPAIAAALRRFDLGGSIGIDFPTLQQKADRQAVDAALAEALAGWPHERTAMNGFGFVQVVARNSGPSLLHRLQLHRTGAAARALLRRAEGLDGAGAVELAAHPNVLAAIQPEWLAELARRSGREVRLKNDAALAFEGSHAQIVAR